MKRKRILIASGEPAIRMIVIKQIGNDYDIIEASNGIQAFEGCLQQRPDLILLDIITSQNPGYSSLTNLKVDPRTKKIPIILITSIDIPMSNTLAGQLGAVGYLNKPFSGAELKALISNIIKD